MNEKTYLIQCNDSFLRNFQCKDNEQTVKLEACGKPCGKLSIKRRITPGEAESRAQVLVDKFKAPQCRLFFLKCIYHLPEYKIANLVETSLRPNIKSHIRYFTVAAKHELELLGY